MFGSIAALIIRRGWLIVLAWLVLAGLLYATAPEWNAVSRDDDVRFFPPKASSRVGQDLLERGFPEDITNSSLILLTERPDGPLTDQDLEYLDQVTHVLRQLQEAEPAVGIR